MKISAVSSYDYAVAKSFSATTKKTEKKQTKKVESAYGVTPNGMNGEKLTMAGNAGEYFILTKNLSNPKVGSKFVIESKLPEYKGLKMLITPETQIKSDTMYIGIKKKGQKTPSFNGRLYGSIRQTDNDIDYTMQNEYIRFWTDGMHSLVDSDYRNEEYAPKLKDDYNFFIPSDGDGTRYKDITQLQGGITKPASYIPAQLNGKNMSLAQTVMANFTKTGKLDRMFDFVKVAPAQGSAFAFLEALRKGQLSDKRPVVFSWGDNFTDVNISKLIYDHEQTESGFTITVLPVEKEKTKSLSIVKVDSADSKEIKEFTEKPQDDEYIESCIVPEYGENKCLAAVGPYVISPEVLEWIKEKYSQDPESFLNPDKGFDFSSMIITPVLKAFNEGEITTAEGKPLSMKLEVISPEDTWSDLGSQKDFSAAMNGIKQGKYSNLPYEMIASIQKNVDDNGNITFNNSGRKLFDDMTKQLNLNAKNVIAYCSE